MSKNRGGWIKLYRDVINSGVFEDPAVFKLWIYLLCRASFVEHDTIFNGMSVHLKSGELICGRKQLAHDLNISESKIYRSLQLLKKEEKIRQVSTKKYSIVTICNWNIFQEESERLTGSPRTSGEHLTNISQTTDGQLENNCQTSDEHIIKRERKTKGKNYGTVECAFNVNNEPPSELEILTWDLLKRRDERSACK